MMYVVAIVIGALLLLYFSGRWLAREARELGTAVRKAWLHASGGQTPEKLIRDAREAFAERGLGPPDLVAVPSEPDRTYAALRQHAIARVPEPALPAALGTVLAINVDHGTAYLRAVAAPAGEPGRERTAFLSFADISDMAPVPLAGHPAVASGADSAIELKAASDDLRYQVPVDPGWGLTAADVAEQLRAMVRDRRRPGAGTVILR